VTRPTVVQVEIADGSGGYHAAAGALTDGNGIFDVRLALPSDSTASVRFRWLAGDGSWQVSPSVQPLALPAS
jgi:hypothetical protein